MRWTMAWAAACAAIPLNAQARSVAIDSEVYRERFDDGAARVERATQLVPGDRVVTILRWNAPRQGRFTVVSPVPAGLVLESASHPALDISTDGGRSWRRLGDPDAIPGETTHLRWSVGGDGRLSYRAVVR